MQNQPPPQAMVLTSNLQHQQGIMSSTTAHFTAANRPSSNSSCVGTEGGVAANDAASAATPPMHQHDLKE